MLSDKIANMLDIFGINIGLRYLNEEQYKTRFGACGTIIIVAFIIIQTIYVGSELILKEKPDVIFSERYVGKPTKFELKPNKYNLAFGAQFPTNFSHFLDPSIYTIYAEQSSMKTIFNEEKQEYEQIWSNTEVSIHPCTKEDFQVEETTEYFTTLPNYDQMYCLDQSNQDLFIEGNYDQDAFAFLRILFKLCDDKTSTIKCQDNVSEILTNSFAAIYFNDIIVNPKNYQPFTTIGRDAFWNVSPQLTKDATIYYRNIYVESDKGILFSDTDYLRQTAISYQDQQKSKETVYHRKYKKLDSLLAEIGGIAKALMIIGFLFIQPLNKLSLYQNLANSLFTFKKEAEEKDQSLYRRGKLTDLIEDHKKKTFLRSTQMVFSNRKIEEEEDQSDAQQQRDMKTNNIVFPISPQKRNQTFLFSPQNPQSKVQFSAHFDREDSYRDKFNEISQQQYFEGQKTQQNGTKTSLNLLEIIKQRNKMIDSTKSQFQQLQQSQNYQPDIQNKLGKQEAIKRQSSLKQSVKNVFRQENKDEQLKLTWADYIRYYIWPFGSFKQKQQQVDYSVEHIYKHLDILFIVKKLLELDKLKQLLLNDDQIKLIQYFPKPCIDIKKIEKEEKEKNLQFKKEKKNKKHEINLLNDEHGKSDKEKAKEAFKALQNIISKPFLTEVDKKIIEMLDGQILENIENNAEYLREMQGSIHIDEEELDDRDTYQMITHMESTERNENNIQKVPVLVIPENNKRQKSNNPGSTSIQVGEDYNPKLPTQQKIDNETQPNQIMIELNKQQQVKEKSIDKKQAELEEIKGEYELQCFKPKTLNPQTNSLNAKDQQSCQYKNESE